MQKSSFFNSVSGDRKYQASDFAAYFGSLLTNGVFPNPGTNLQVVSNSDMTVTVNIGKGWISGYFYLNDAVLILPIDVADGILKRIDRIALRMDTVNRSIAAVVKKGTFSSTPVALALQRDADAYELALADVYVDAGVTSITGAAITDQRLNTVLCGWVNSLIQADTTAIFDQYQAWFASTTAAEEADFSTWFDSIKGQLSGDIATNLTVAVNAATTTANAATTTADAAYATATAAMNVLAHQTSIFGVKFSLASSNPAGTRTDVAAGIAFTPGIGAAGSSGFDGYSLYDLKTCNRAAGAVTAYLGEPGFSASTKDTFVEIPKGYYRRWTDATYEYYQISKEVFPGAKLHPCFERGGEIKEFVYLAAYKSSYDGASKHESKSGALPDVVISRTTSRTRSRVRGVYASMQDLQVRDWLNLLFMVESGTRDCQTAVGKGYSEMPYSATHVATVAESAVNRIIIANAFADVFVIGQEISIGTSLGLNGIVADRTISAIAVYDASNKAITFSGAAVNIAIGNIVWTSRQKNGKTDAIGQGTGRATGTDGTTAIRYRGIENPWGNVWEWVDNLNIRNNLGYSDIEGRINLYSDTDFGTNYTPFAAAFPAANGYMKRPMFDENIGVGCLPSDASGSSSAQYFCDYYYQAAGDLAAFVGGFWNNGASDGLWYWSLDVSAADASVGIGARLLEVP